MLYVAFYKNKPGVALKSKDVIEKSRKWWNEGGKPREHRRPSPFMGP